jgi:hypothetical protein
MKGLGEIAQRKILGDNARRFMNLPRSAGARFGGGARISRLGTSIPGTG